MADRNRKSRVLIPQSGQKRERALFCDGFTLIELLVVIAIIAILAAILFPVFASAKSAGQKAKCASQLKQLAAAIILYADDNNSRYVPAAYDIDGPGGGLIRWHGVRNSPTDDFDPSKGPLWKYMARSGGLKECPLSKELKDVSQDENAFESNCGGYGYNMYYVGGTYYKRTNPFPTCAQIASAASDIAQPSKTVMLTDTGMPMNDHMVEYSFCEPPFMLYNGRLMSSHSAPSVHFGHNGRVNVAWCDGHVTSEKMSFTDPMNCYNGDNQKNEVGWFGPNNNSLFDNN